jgi:hypothetical protein
LEWRLVAAAQVHPPGQADAELPIGPCENAWECAIISFLALREVFSHGGSICLLGVPREPIP